MTGPTRSPVINRTVSYFELVDALNGRMGHADWGGALDVWEPRSPLTYNLSGDALSGTVVPTPGPPARKYLCIAKAKDFVPNEAERATGEQRTMQSRGNQWDPVDNLYVRFLDFGNCVAVLRESTSSPTITTLAKWLTKDATFGDTHWIAQAVIDPEARARILRAGRIREVGVIASAADLAGQDGGLLSTLSSLNQFGDVMVELRIFTETGGDHQAEQALLSRFASSILRSPLEAALRKGHVKTVSEGSEAAASIDMIRDRITKGLPVQLSRGHDRSIRAEAACAALDDAIAADEDLLRQILMP